MIKLPINYLEVEEIYSNSFGKGLHSLAITSANSGEGCTTMAFALCQRCMADGKRTLLVEFNMQHPELSDLSGHIRPGWQPNPESAENSIIKNEDANFDILLAPCDVDILKFRNTKMMSDLYQYWMERYDAVIFDTSPVNARNKNNIQAESVCAMADATIMMVMAGVTRQTQFKTALDRLSHSNVTLAGIVFNDYYNPRLADEICRETHRLDNWFPDLMNKIRRYVRHSSFFNIDL